MQLGIHPDLARRVRDTGFIEPDVDPMELGSSRSLAQPQPNHPFAASTSFFGTAVFDVEGGQGSRVNTLDIMRVIFENEQSHSLLERGPATFCVGWTSYPRFAPTKYEIDLVDIYFPNSVALPFSSAYGARMTAAYLGKKLGDYEGEIRVVNPENTELYFVELPGLEKNPRSASVFLEFREVREYLGTGMTPRQAYFECLVAKGKVEKLSPRKQNELNEETNIEYRRQVVNAFGIKSVDDVFLKANGTAVLVDFVSAFQTAVGKNDLKVSTSGVPYSDTPLTVAMLTGNETQNSRSQIVQDVIDASIDTQLIMLELGDNPLLSATDLEAINEFAKGAGIPIVVDVSVVGAANINFEKLFELEMLVGAIASTTKYSSGTVMGGVFIANRDCQWEKQSDFLEELEMFGKNGMYWAEAAVHIRDMATLNDRMKMHNKNAESVASMLNRIPGINVNYPTINLSQRNIEPFIKDGAGFGGLLSIELCRDHFSQDEILAFVNELPNQMVNALSFGLPYSVALPYAATVFPEQTQEKSGCDPLIVRISMGAHPGEDMEVYAAVMSTLQKVVGWERVSTADSFTLA